MRGIIRTPAGVLLILLLLQAAVFYGMPKERPADLVRPLATISPQLNGWMMVREDPIEPEVQKVLRADESLSRLYSGPGGVTASLFVAFFKSQATGVAPHSPKNCLPGAGWVATAADSVPVPVNGGAQSIEVNRYIIAKGESRLLVLYWYQSHGRVVASEYAAKLYLMYDSVRHLRSDTAIVRVSVPVTDSLENAEKSAYAFAQAAYPDLQSILPQ